MVLDFPSASLMDPVICWAMLHLKLFEQWVDGRGEVLGAAASVAELLVDRPDGVLRAARQVPELLIDGHAGHLTAAAASVPLLLIEGHDGVIGAPSAGDFLFIFFFKKAYRT